MTARRQRRRDRAEADVPPLPRRGRLRRPQGLARRRSARIHRQVREHYLERADRLERTLQPGEGRRRAGPPAQRPSTARRPSGGRIEQAADAVAVGPPLRRAERLIAAVPARVAMTRGGDTCSTARRSPTCSTRAEPILGPAHAAAHRRAARRASTRRCASPSPARSRPASRRCSTRSSARRSRRPTPASAPRSSPGTATATSTA